MKYKENEWLKRASEARKLRERRVASRNIDQLIDFAFQNERQSGKDPLAMDSGAAYSYADQYQIPYDIWLAELQRRGWRAQQ